MAIKKTIETEVGDMPEETFRKYGSDVKQAAEDVINTIKSEYAPLYTQLIKDPFASEQDLINNPNINENNLQSIRDYVNTAFDGERYKIFLFPKTMRQGIKAGFTSTSETFSETKGFWALNGRAYEVDENQSRMDSETKNDMDKLLAYETSHEVNNKQKDLGKKTVSKYNLKKISLNTKITNTKADLFS